MLINRPWAARLLLMSATRTVATSVHSIHIIREHDFIFGINQSTKQHIDRGRNFYIFFIISYLDEIYGMEVMVEVENNIEEREREEKNYKKIIRIIIMR